VLEAVGERRLDWAVVGRGGHDPQLTVVEEHAGSDLVHFYPGSPGQVGMMSEAVADVMAQHGECAVDHLPRPDGTGDLHR
jgi:hypothetical protein